MHIQNIMDMTIFLADLGYTVLDKMITLKIIYTLPPSFNSIIATWSNVLKNEQTVDHLDERLLRHESLLQRQGGSDI